MVDRLKDKVAIVAGAGSIGPGWANGRGNGKARAKQVPMAFGGDAWDVAWAAVYLAGDEARHVTGIELVVDGGITLKY